MFLDSFFAPRCAACDDSLAEAAPFCLACRESLWPVGAACPLCALPIEGPVSAGCRRCRLRPPPLAASVAPYRFGGELAVALRRLKYGRRGDISRQLAPLFRLPLELLIADCDLAMPIPLHWRRELSRGFNQARVLLRHALQGPSRAKIDAVSLRRCRNTAAQSGLRFAARADNVRGAFAVTKRRRLRIRGARVLLFDDVITTGATLFAAARALKKAGAHSVVGFALARAA